MPQLNVVSETSFDARAQRKQQIIDVLQGRMIALPMREIARLIGLKKSPYLASLLSELVEENIITWDWDKYNSRLHQRVFRYTRPDWR